MTWTWEEIERDWLLGTPVVLAPASVVAGFERAEAVLGRPWIDAVGEVRGSSPTLTVANWGLRLESIDAVSGAEEMVEKIRRGDRSAYSELAAIHLIRAGERDVEVEIAPTVRVGNRDRRPDFRVRRSGESWTHVEVSRPDTSELHERVGRVLAVLTGQLDSMPAGSGVEVLLRREPADSEVSAIADRVRVELAADMRSRANRSWMGPNGPHLRSAA